MGRDQVNKSFDRQLLVEGFDDWTFFDQLAKHLAYRGKFGIVECVGWTQIEDELKNIISDTDYFRTLKHIAIVRDADRDTNAFSSVKRALGNANREVSKRKNEEGESQPIHEYPIPSQHLLMVEGSPSVSVMILPGIDDQGALENYVIKAIKSDKLWNCVEDYFNCLPTVGLSIAQNRRAKSEIGVFISGKVVDPDEATSRDSRRKLLSDIYRLKWWKDNKLWDDENFSDASKFLKQLVEDIPFDDQTPSPTTHLLKP
ncbi:MAG: hypothetical protein OXG23_11805 [Chloroflexi bacterium]|nr:hypothetical protein [Chloroflexota bacterium]